MAPQILIGTTSFRELREETCYYVDKTSFLTEFLRERPAKVTLLTRPRRFGKTLTMDTLKEFLDIGNATLRMENGRSGRNLFEGLEIMRHEDVCVEWMHKYPVAFLSLKNVEGTSFEEAVGFLRQQLRFLFTDFDFLAANPILKVGERDDFIAMMKNKADSTQLATSLQVLCRAMEAYYGKPAVLLVDEYDVPLNYAKLKGYYSEMVDFLRKFLGTALKDNRSLKFAVLTGCLRVAKESIFTGLNNFKCYGISEERFADKIGFTSAEVNKILADFGLSHKAQEVKEWYDGYRFGLEEEMYCPWDVLQYVYDHKFYPSKAPEMYWNNSSGNDIVKNFLEHSGRDVQNKFEILLHKGSIDASLREALTYGDLYDSEDNIWTLLYLTGYLTKATPGQMPSSSGKIGLKIPNKEVYQIYTESVDSWFKKIVLGKNRDDLLKAFWSGDGEKLGPLLSQILSESISYYDYGETFYHAFLVGLFSTFDCVVKSNRESGEGRSDITVERVTNDCAAVIEVKWTKNKEKTESLADVALRQIDNKRYSDSVIDYGNIVHWGIAFYRKSCVAKAVIKKMD